MTEPTLDTLTHRIQVRGQRFPIPVRRRPVTGLGGGAFGFCLIAS